MSELTEELFHTYVSYTSIKVKCNLCDKSIPEIEANDYGEDLHCCDECFQEHSFECTNCENVEIRTSDTFLDVHSGNLYCEDCRPDTTSLFFTQNASPEIKGTTFKKILFSRRFGVELESQRGRVPQSSTTFSAVRDGSVRGPEYVSPILQGDEGFEAIKKLCSHRSLQSKNAIDRKCGFHLHLDATDLTEWQVAKLGLHYKLIQNFLYRLVAPSRTDNSYCKSIATAYENVSPSSSRQSLLFALYQDGFCGSPGQRGGDKKYEFFNANSYFYRKTIEIRLHEGTFDASLIQDWINLNQALFALILSKVKPFKEATLLFKSLFEKYPFTAKIIKKRLNFYKGADSSDLDIETHLRDILKTLED